MDKIILDAINKGIDETLKEFLDNPDSIFDNKREQKILQYQVINALKKWKKSKTCVVKNCLNNSIENSHTIQKSTSIKHISENGHVLTPYLSLKVKDIVLNKIGINNASTFPGYCSYHENLFNEFEHTKSFEKGEHLGLQLYRTICREIVITENHIEQLKFHVVKYKEFRDKKMHESILDKIGKKILVSSTLEFKRARITNNDYRLLGAKKQLDELNRYLSDFLYVYQKAILHDLNSKKFSKVTYIAIEFDREIPVALAGRGNFNIKLKTKLKGVEVVFNVLPFENKTYIFISTLKKFEKELKAYMQYFTHPLLLISMIESWMIHGSDHWFLKPSVWESIENNYRQKILDEILDKSYNIGNEFRYSIFNEAKLEVINLMEKDFDNLNDLDKRLLEHEKKKLTTANN